MRKADLESRGPGQCNYNGTVKTPLRLIVRSDLGELSIVKPEVCFINFLISGNEI